MNNRIEISDFISKLQEIDYATIIRIATPLVLLYTSKRVTSTIISNRKLRKDFKLKGVKTASLPIEVQRKYDDIDEEEILKKEFGNLILDFAKTVKEKIPEANLSTFLNNINTLKTTTQNYSLENKVLNNHIQGEYISETNTISLSKKNFSLTIYHELFHAISTIYDKASETAYCGFNQIIKKKESIGNGLNEGYTQLLSVRYFGDRKIMTNAYIYEQRIASIIEKIVGKEKMRSLYFSSNLIGLMNELTKYSSEEEVHDFITSLDFVNDHMGDKYITPSSKQIITNNLKYINKFLVKTYLQKNLFNSNNTEISFSNIEEILILLPSKVSTKIRNYKIFDADEIAKIFAEIIAEHTSKNTQSENKK